MKKIISAALAALLSISALSTFVSADDTTIISEGVVARPAIKVTMPKSLSFVFNPYGLTVDAKGKIGTAIRNSDDDADLNTGVVVPSYIFDETTKELGWIITNNTGAPIKCGIVANSQNTTTGDGFVVTTSETGGIADAATYRSLKLSITAHKMLADKTYQADSAATAVIVNTTAIEAAAGGSILDKCAETPVINSKGTLIDGILATAGTTDPVPGALAIKMTGTIANSGKLNWLETDIPKVNFIFAFDLAGGAST